jgi:hypothetical protein
VPYRNLENPLREKKKERRKKEPISLIIREKTARGNWKIW